MGRTSLVSRTLSGTAHPATPSPHHSCCRRRLRNAHKLGICVLVGERYRCACRSGHAHLTRRDTGRYSRHVANVIGRCSPAKRGGKLMAAMSVRSLAWVEVGLTDPYYVRRARDQFRRRVELARSGRGGQPLLGHGLSASPSQPRECLTSRGATQRWLRHHPRGGRLPRTVLTPFAFAPCIPPRVQAALSHCVAPAHRVAPAR
mmetsp:Transcript_23933/g.73286  ORF Transcript_23933/g.73286 Transcript_23933/m.73286 type:complete len:203 (+) Transcript_23933:2036-2644(+)